MYISFAGPNGEVLADPTLSMLSQALSADFHHYWGDGSKDVAIYADEHPLLNDSGGLIVRKGTRQLAVARMEPHGYHLQFVVMFEEPLVAIQSTDYSSTVKLYRGGEPWLIPTAFFVPFESAQLAVFDFLRTGEASPRLTWVKLHEQQWPGMAR